MSSVSSSSQRSLSCAKKSIHVSSRTAGSGSGSGLPHAFPKARFHGRTEVRLPASSWHRLTKGPFRSPIEKCTCARKPVPWHRLLICVRGLLGRFILGRLQTHLLAPSMDPDLVPVASSSSPIQPHTSRCYRPPSVSRAALLIA